MRRTAALAALLVIGLAGAVVLAGPPRGNGFFEQQTEHYMVRTDISPQMAALIGNHMETIFREYANRFADYGQIRQRFNVTVFGTEAAYERAVPPQVAGSSGVFTNRNNVLAAHCEGRTNEQVFRTLYHEGFHQFMYSVISRDCPIWLNEGIAEYFSEATWNGGSFTLGEIPTRRLEVLKPAIRTRGYFRFARLFALTNEQWLQMSSSDPTKKVPDLLYSEAWSIVHFLIHAENGRYVGMLNAYLKALSAGRDPRRAFGTVFGEDVAEFETTWANYVLSLEPSPKFECHDNMTGIMVLANMAYSDVRQFDSVSDLRRLLYTRQTYRWELPRPLGGRLQSTDREGVAALFRCPLDKSSATVSHLVVRIPGSNMPMLVCDHHPGIIIKAYFRQEQGGIRVVVEEQVRETVSADLRRAMQQAYVAQFR